ncbi:MAG: hypothetical protein ACLURV_08045 [Gallintestinimicrobium sp.]
MGVTKELQEDMTEKFAAFGIMKKDRPFNVLLAGVSYCDGTYRIERKPENLYSFEYIYSGKGMLVIDGQRLSRGRGMLFFKRGIPHCIGRMRRNRGRRSGSALTG